jgi:L-fuconolactonase
MIHLDCGEVRRVVLVVGQEDVTDAHVHVWELGRRPQPWIDPVAMSVINRDHPLAELESELDNAGVVGSVLVQVLNEPDETDDLLWLGRSRVVDAVVGWVDLLDPHVADRLDELGSHASGTWLAGIRHQALAEPDAAGWLARVGAGPGLGALGDRGLACDLIVRPEHLDVAHAVVAAHPGTTFVLDHAGKPPVLSGWASQESQRWAALVARLAGLDNVSAKLSGLTTMGDLTSWRTSDLAPYADHLLSCFGADRVIFGSDWPVSRRAATYPRTIAAARELVSRLSRAEQVAVLSANARRVYRRPVEVGA